MEDKNLRDVKLQNKTQKWPIFSGILPNKRTKTEQDRIRYAASVVEI